MTDRLFTEEKSEFDCTWCDKTFTSVRLWSNHECRCSRRPDRTDFDDYGVSGYEL